MIYLRLESLLEQDNIYLCMRCITTDVFSLCTGNEAITAGWGFGLFRVYIPNINKLPKWEIRRYMTLVELRIVSHIH